ncbi:MAG TPA: hypothetical protein VFQ35_03510 [Polyangiaceae bacterium]|nr:hypothetical protein [Polyangiaceae bacterium]
MTRKLASLGFSIAAFVLGLSATREAHAVEYYRAGKVSVSLERVFGLHYWHSSVEQANGLDSVSSGTVVGLGWYAAQSPYHLGRAAVDGFIIDRLSLGGSVGFYSASGDNDDSGVLLYPRVGYVIPISRVFSFWPRGGFSFIKGDSSSLFGLAAEGMFVASPSDDWHILFGPTFDFGLTGHVNGDRDWSHFAIGFPAVGLMGTF